MTSHTRILGLELGPLGTWVIAAMVWGWCLVKIQQFSYLCSWF